MAGSGPGEGGDPARRRSALRVVVDTNLLTFARALREQGTHLACAVPIAQLACDGNTEPEPGTGGIRFTIGVMADTAEEVDRLTGQMRQAGALITKAPVDAEFFAGRSAYLCDPEGNYFEIAWAEPGNPIVAAARRVAGS